MTRKRLAVPGAASRLAALATLCVSSLLLSCGDAGTEPPPADEPGPANMVVTPEQITVNALGSTIQYTATVWDSQGRVLDDVELDWYSSDTTVARVDSTGMATTVGDGTATILAATAGTVFGWGEMTVTAKPLRIVTLSLRPGVVGIPYSRFVEAEGTQAPTWSILDGALPEGLELNGSTGEISGTPTAPGEALFTVQLADRDTTLTRQFTIGVILEELGIDFGEEQWVLVPAGSFLMGSDTDLPYSNPHQPVHQVNITGAFLMQKTEVTQYQWETVMGYNPSGWPDCGDLCPVEAISWDEVQLFLAALNQMDPGKNYRLPTEAQWEYAARAGNTGDYGGSADPLDQGWFIENSVGSKTHVVAQKTPNDWGLFDIHGNVEEWVRDWMGTDYYSVSPTDNPGGPATGTAKVFRGGSCQRPAARGTSWYRASTWTYYIDADRGFRLVRDPG